MAARVNAEEITVHQINHVLEREALLAAESAAPAKREILDRLIEQQILQQQAIARNLHRSPRVMQAIEAAKSEILARAYAELIAGAQPEPDAAEVRKYYVDNPALFAQRRLFTVEEIAAAVPEELADALRAHVAAGASMASVAAWLKSRGLDYAEFRGVRAAEHVPLRLLPGLHAMKVGEVRALESAGALNVFRLLAVQEAPVDEASAAPRIRQALLNQRLAQAFAREIAQVKAQSRIEYLGEFASATPLEATGARGATPAAPDFAKGVRGLR